MDGRLEDADRSFGSPAGSQSPRQAPEEGLNSTASPLAAWCDPAAEVELSPSQQINMRQQSRFLKLAISFPFRRKHIALVLCHPICENHCNACSKTPPHPAKGLCDTGCIKESR